MAIVITKCESLTAEQATILEHRVVWAFSKLLDTDLCPTVFFGAFENTALPPEADKNLIDQVTFILIQCPPGPKKVNLAR